MLKRWWPVLLLLCVEVAVAWANVKTGTWLIGWDSTQPELNFSLNLSRGLSSVWQEYRGLGVTDGMAHSANLIHIVYTWVLAMIVGTAGVRYTYVMLSHLAGGVGTYVVLRWMGRRVGGERVSRWVALAGALFYMFNPYTLQMFYQPLEVFVTHFAALPWLTFTLLQYVALPSKRNLGWFALVNVLSLPQAHVPTLFIVWMMLAGCLLLPALLLRFLRYGKQILMVVLVSLGIHGFWGIPYIYSAINNARNIGEAKINVLSNPEVILRNDAYGDVESIVKMQGFSLAYEDWNQDRQFGLQMPEWVGWWSQQWVMWVMTGVVAVAGLGIVTSLVQRKWWMGGTLLMYGLALGNLGARIPYVRGIGVLLRDWVPYYEAIFRFTFTKYALVYAFVLTILIAIGIMGLTKLWRGGISRGVAIAVIGVIAAISWPVWQGQLFYQQLKLHVPTEYHNVFKYFEVHDAGRVLPLPYPDFWGWQSNEWGYRGSGFVWQGIANPTLYGAFNAWSPYNETFYNEFSTALSSGSKETIARALGKFDVQYVLLDETGIAPGQDEKILRIEETKRLASELGWEEKFQEGFLTVWEVGKRGDKFVSVLGSYTWVDADTSKVREDVVYGEVGHYVGSKSGNPYIREPVVTYPFANLLREETKNVVYGEKGVLLTASGAQGHELLIPGWKVGDIVRVEFENDEPIPAYYVDGQAGPRFLGEERPEEDQNVIYFRIDEGKAWAEYLQDSRFQMTGERGTVEVPGSPQIYNFGIDGQGTMGNCDVLKRGRAKKQGSVYSADDRGAVCDYVVMGVLDPRLPYLMRVKGENKEGRSLKFFLWNTGSKRNDIEYLLGKGAFDQTFSLLPWSWDGAYTLNIETRSFGQRAENKVEPVEVRYFPLKQIAGAKIITSLKPPDSSVENRLRIVEVKKTGTWLYRVKVEGTGLLKLSQGYDEGWVGVGMEHVKVDGWANGWIISGSGEVTIFYWPQLLEYVGFGLLGLTTIWFLRK